MNRSTLPILAAALGLLTSPAFADDQLANYQLIDPGTSTLVSVSGNYGASPESGYAGRYHAQLNGVDINDFCVDLYHNINFSDSYTADISHNVSDVSGAQNGNGYYNGGLSSALDSGYYSSVSSPLTNQQRADEIAYLVHSYGNATASTIHTGSDLNTTLTSVSLAIWDIETDGGDGLRNGAMQVPDSGEVAQFSPLVNSLEADASKYKNNQYLDVTWIQSPTLTGIQDFAYVKPVPEAGTCTLFGLLLAGGALKIRAARKKKSATPA